MSIHITNIKSHLSTLTLSQLNKELIRVSNLYTGAQVRYLAESSYQDWQAHITLIEEEILRRG